MNFDVFDRQSLQYHPRSGSHCINQFCLVADGACPHPSCLDSIWLRNLLGHLVAFVGRRKELDALCQEGRSLAPLGSPRVSLPGASGVSCPCFQLELELHDPNKLGPALCMCCHYILPGRSSGNSSCGTSFFSAFCQSFSFWAAMFSLRNILDSLLFFQ